LSSAAIQAKPFMDRTYALKYPHHKLKNKVGGAIAVAGRRGSVNTLSIINNFFLGHDMLATGLGISGYGTKKRRSQTRQTCHARSQITRKTNRPINKNHQITRIN